LGRNKKGENPPKRVLCPKSSLSLTFIKPTLFNHPKHIAHILDHDPGDVGDGVDVILGVVGEAGAGHEVEVLEDGAEAFADAVVELAEWGVAVDEEDGVVGGELGHGGEAARRVVHCHWIRFFMKGMNCHLFAAIQNGWQLCAGSQTRKESNPADSKASHAQPP